MFEQSNLKWLPKCDVINQDELRFAVEIQHELLRNLLAEETRYMPPADFLKGQKELTASLRAELVNWIVGVADRFYLDPDTVHLAIYILDRHTSSYMMPLSKYQLAGTAALFLAAKTNEIHPPQL